MNTRAKGANAERTIIKYYKSLGYRVFNPMETKFSARLPFGDFLAYNDFEVLLVEAKATRNGWSFAEILKIAKSVKSDAFILEMCWLDEGKPRPYYFDGDDFKEKGVEK